MASTFWRPRTWLRRGVMAQHQHAGGEEHGARNVELGRWLSAGSGGVRDVDQPVPVTCVSERLAWSLAVPQG